MLVFENQVLLGDCLLVLREIPDETFHSIVMDPPYGLGEAPTVEEIIAYLQGADLKTGDFMGKDWDIPSVLVWRELFRVLKPGGHVLSFGGCYDEHTEVLTRQGWVKFPDVTGDEEFASLNLESHQVEWQRPKEVVRQRHDGPMMYYRTNKVDLLVTPNHNMLVAPMGRGRDGTPNEYRLVRADTHGRAVRMTKTSKGRVDEHDPAVFRLPAVKQLTSHGHEEEIPEKIIPLEAWLPFFGLWLAEGSASVTKNKSQRGHEHGHSYQVSVCHFDINNLKEIQQRLADWFDVRIYPEQGKLRINSKQLVMYLRQFGKAWEKFLPAWVKELPADRLRVIWDWYLRGDGWAHQRGYTSSPRLRDDWQEVAMYMGISADWSTVKADKLPGRIRGREVVARRPQYVVRFNHAQNHPEVYDREKKRRPVRTLVSAESWAGQMVYCVELPKHHTLYVRRNGKAVWCGNTRTWDLISLGARAAGFQKRDTFAEEFPGLQWVQSQGMPKSTNISKQIDKKKGAKRKVVGKRTDGRYKYGFSDAAKAAQGGVAHEHSKGWVGDPTEITAPATPEAQQWDGYGTGLKPCWEPILVFRKPLEKKLTLADQILKTGTGGLNIDACRVKHSSKKDFEAHKAGVEAIKARGGSMKDSWKNSSDLSGANDVTSAGRWPSNVVIVHTPACALVGLKRFKGSGTSKTFHEGYEGESATGFIRGHSHPGNQHGDEDGLETAERWECVPGCPAAVMDEQSGNRPGTLAGRADPDESHENPGDNGGTSTFGGGNSRVYADEGGASRYYPQFDGVPFYYVGKATPRETSLDGEIENSHPTKKPVRLMQWLIRLVTPKNLLVCPNRCEQNTASVSGVQEPVYAETARTGGLLRPVSKRGRRKGRQEDFQPEVPSLHDRLHAADGEREVLLRSLPGKESEASTTDVFGVRLGFSSGGHAPEKLLQGMRRQGSRQDNPQDLSGVPNSVLSEVEGAPPVLLQEVQHQSLRAHTQEGPETHGQGVSSSLVPGSPDGRQGLRVGTPARDGEASREVSLADRDRAPSEWGQDGQPSREPRHHEEEGPRSAPQAPTGAHRVSTLSRENSDSGQCPSCGAGLIRSGGLVLDPYCGSGSTLHAAIEEDCVFTGIEKDPKFHAISVKRVAIVSSNRQDLMTQKSLFALAMGELE